MTTPKPKPKPSSMSLFGSAPQGAPIGSGNLPTQGSVTVGIDSGPRSTSNVVTGTNQSHVFDSIHANLSTTNIKNLFLKMDKTNDPFLKMFMSAYGVTDKKVAKAIWDDAATYAAHLAQTGEHVDFLNDVLKSKTFIDTYLSIPKNLLGAGGSGGSSGPQTRTSRTLSDAFTKDGSGNLVPSQQTNADFVATLKNVLGHTPTQADLEAYAPVMELMKKRYASGKFNTASTTTYDAKGNSVTHAGKTLDTRQFLYDNITKLHQQKLNSGKESASASNASAYAQAASEYGFNVYGPDGKTLSPLAHQQLANIESGKITLDDAIAGFKTAALAHYAYLKPQFDAGLTLKQIAAPAFSAIANILEKDPNTVGVNDTLVQKYLQGVDGKGIMPMYKFEAMLRQDPSWQYTNNAHQTFADLAMNLGQRFGMVG